MSSFKITLLIVLPIICYLIGSINWALIISRSKKKDIRSMGSGNPGTLNMSRNFGLGIGLLTFFLDILKGAVPVLVAYFLFRNDVVGEKFVLSDFAMYLCGLSVVLGHIYPIWLKFKGGKGIASTIGVLLVCEIVQGPIYASIMVTSLVAAVVFIYLTEFGAMGSFIAITPSAISGSIRLYLKYARVHDKTTVAFFICSSMLILLICFFTWFAHRKNIERMLAGDEHPTSIKEMVVKLKMKKAQAKKEKDEK